MPEKKDLTDLDDVKTLVDRFYGKVRSDELLAPVFNERIQDRWPLHLDKMYRFWQTVLLGEHTYLGSPFPPHANLPVDQTHFQRWLALFRETLDELFIGEKADEAKWRADKMAEMFLSRINYFKEQGFKNIFLGRNGKPMDKTSRPLKRNENLLKLSRQHHAGLLFGWKIRQGVKNNTAPERMMAYTAYFWENHLRPHFKEEEEILFFPAEDPLVMKAKQEHALIEQEVNTILRRQDSLSTEQVLKLADQLDRHIRFEERELFTHLEKILSPAQLQRIGILLDEAARPKSEEEDRFEDPFWNLKSSL